MRTVRTIALLLLVSGSTASLAANQSSTILDPQNLQTCSGEINTQAALEQARRDTGTGLEGPNLGDPSQTARTAQLDRNSGHGEPDGGFTPSKGYHAEM